MEQQKVEALLTQADVPYRTMWGKYDPITNRYYKSFDDLMREIRDDGVIPYIRENGRFATLRRRVFLHAEYVDLMTLQTYKVEEQYRVNPDGTFESRILRREPESTLDFEQPSCTENMPPGMTAEEAAMQLLMQELRIRRPSKKRLKVLGYVAMKARISRAFYGIDSIETGYDVLYSLTKAECKPVYVEYGSDGAATISGWRGGKKPPHIAHKRVRLQLLTR